MTDTRVELTIQNGVAVAALNRPEVRNAIDEPTRAALGEILERVAADDGIRALVLTGTGTAFCAGGDISAMRQRLGEPAGTLGGKGWRRQRRLHGMIGALHALEKPTIAAVNGAALALSKSILDQTFELTADQAFALGAQAQAICYTTDDHQRSVAAFLNRQAST
jgi:enoyl-CoA hydratase/carnithine racemase